MSILFKNKTKKLMCVAAFIAAFSTAIYCYSTNTFQFNSSANFSITESDLLSELSELADQFYNNDKEIFNLTNNIQTIAAKGHDEHTESNELKIVVQSIKEKLNEMELPENSKLKICFDKIFKKVNDDQIISKNTKNELINFSKQLESINKTFKYFEEKFKKELEGFYRQSITINNPAEQENRDLEITITRENECENTKAMPDYIALSLIKNSNDDELFNLKDVETVIDKNGINQYVNLKLEIFDKKSNELVFSQPIIQRPLDGKLQWYCSGRLDSETKTIENYKDYTFAIVYQTPDNKKGNLLLKTTLSLGEFQKPSLEYQKAMFKFHVYQLLKQL